MIKKVLMIFIAICIAHCAVHAYAAADGGNYALDLKKGIIENEQCTVKNELLINCGSIVYGFFLPVYSDKIIIKSKSAGKSVKIEIDNKEYNILLDTEETKYEFDTPVRLGEKNLKISSYESVIITEIVFGEITEKRSQGASVNDMTDYERSLSTAVIYKIDSNLLFANGAKRYVNYNNLSDCARLIDGSCYVPVSSLAVSLGCYFEQIKENDYIYLRREDREAVYNKGIWKYYINSKEEADLNIGVKDINGVTYIELRALCEIFGEYVCYKNGYIVIDYRSKAKEITDNGLYFSSLEADFSKFAKSEKSTKTYHVSKSQNASDRNDGSSEFPFATIRKASEAAEAGDTIIIHEGVWRETIKPENDGTPQNPIIYKAADNEKVVLSALEEISGFNKYRDNMLVAALPWDLGVGRNQVFYEGKNLVEARYPNSVVEQDGLVKYKNGLKLDPLWITEGDIKVNSEDNSIAESDTLLKEADGYWDGAVFVSEHGTAWTFGTAIVDSFKNGKLNLTKMSEKWWFGANPKYPNFGYLTCHVNCIDRPGEWVIKNGLLYIMPPEGETADTLKLELKKRQLTADLSESKYVWLEGFETVGGSINMKNSTMCVIKNCDMKYLTHAVYAYDQRELFIDDGNPMNSDGIPTKGEMGIYIGGENNAFIDSKIDFSAGAGLYLVGSYTYVDNNVINNCGYLGCYPNAIFISTEAWKPYDTKRGGHTIINNSMKNSLRNAVGLSRDSDHYGWVTLPFLPMEIAYNNIEDGTLFSYDTGMIYMWGSQIGNTVSKTLIHDNILSSGITDDVYIKGTMYMLGVIYQDNIMHGADCYNNLMFSKIFGVFDDTVFIQPEKASWSTTGTWNNTDINVFDKSVSELEACDYPGGRPFYAGAKNGEKFTLNYDRFNGEKQNIYYASDAVKSGELPTKDNKVTLSAKGDYVKFENVCFDDLNCINLSYTADFYKDDTDVEVIIGKDIESGQTYRMNLKRGGKSLSDITTESAYIFDIFGNQNVYVAYSDGNGIDLEKIYLSKRDLRDTIHTYDYRKIYGGEFGLSGKSSFEAAPSSRIDTELDTEHTLLYNTWSGGWVRYANVKTDKTLTEFYMLASSAGKHSGNIVSLRKNSPYGEILAQVTVDAQSWTVYDEYRVKLQSPLEAGEYDLYLTFDGNNDKTSNIYTFGLE